MFNCEFRIIIINDTCFTIIRNSDNSEYVLKYKRNESKRKTSLEYFHKDIVHKNILSIYDYDSVKFDFMFNGKQITEIYDYIKMEYLPIIFNINNEIYDRRHIKKIMFDTLHGLEYLHSKGFICRKITENQILGETDENGVVNYKLICLKNIVYVDDSSSSLHIKDLKSITPYYAPETIKKMIVNQKTNVYSLGVSLYNLFIQKCVFRNQAWCFHCRNTNVFCGEEQSKYPSVEYLFKNIIIINGSSSMKEDEKYPESEKCEGCINSKNNSEMNISNDSIDQKYYVLDEDHKLITILLLCLEKDEKKRPSVQDILKSQIAQEIFEHIN